MLVAKNFATAVQSALIAMASVGFAGGLVGCGFSDSSVSESERRLAEREKVIESYQAIQGVYDGEIRTPERSMPAQVYLGYTEVQSGQDADGRPIFQPRLTARLLRPMVLSNDISMTGDFEPGAGVLTLTSASRQGGSDSANSEVFYLRARRSGESFSGDLRVRDQLYGHLSVSRTTKVLPSNWEVDAGGLSEREKKITAFKRIQGLYTGEIDLGSQVTPVRVTVGYIEIPNGFDADGRPRFNVVLTLRLSRPELIVMDVTMTGGFDPLTRVVTLSEQASTGGASSGANPSQGGIGGGAGDSFYFRGVLREDTPLRLEGELRVKDQPYGQLRVSRESEQVPAATDLDEELFNQIYRLIKPLEGRYLAEHRTDKLEVIQRFEIRVVTGTGRLPGLLVNYRRNEHTAAVSTNLVFRPGFTPPRISFTTSYAVGSGGAVVVSLEGQLEADGTIRGILTHGNLTGVFSAKKLSGLTQEEPLKSSERPSLF